MQTRTRRIGVGVGQTGWGMLLLIAALGMSAMYAGAQARAARHADSLAAGFQTPPDSAKPLAIGGGSTGTRTSQRLPATWRRCAGGYSGAILMDANGSDQEGNIGVAAGPMFGTPAWQELFLHT